MNDLSKRLRDAATHRETVTPDEHGVRVLSASLDRAKALMTEAADALDARWQTMESAPDVCDGILVGYTHPVAGWITLVAPQSLVRQLKHIVVESRIHASYYYWQPLPTPPEDV